MLWTLRSVGVEEWIITVIRSMYDGVTTAVRMKMEKEKERVLK